MVAFNISIPCLKFKVTLTAFSTAATFSALLDTLCILHALHYATKEVDTLSFNPLIISLIILAICGRRDSRGTFLLVEAYIAGETSRDSFFVSHVYLTSKDNAILIYLSKVIMELALVVPIHLLRVRLQYFWPMEGPAEFS